jgi:hypothetical protein
MSFTSLQSEKFSKLYDKSDYQALDPIVKIQYVQKGNNIVFGRTLLGDEYSELIYIGKVLENTVGRNFLSADCWLDITFPHVIYITGTRGSGKSFDLGVLLEGISQLSTKSNIQNGVTPICSFLIDTQSQFWTLKYPPNETIPDNRRQLNELAKWNIDVNYLSKCKILVPKETDRITGDEQVFHLRPCEVRHEEWCSLIREDVYSPQGHILGGTIEEFKNRNFSIEDMMNFIADPHNFPSTQESSRNALLYKLEDYKRADLFSKEGLDIRALLVPGQCNVFMVRDLRDVDKALVAGILARQLFVIMGEHHKRLKVEQFFHRCSDSMKVPPRVWLLLDEAHIIAPGGTASPARDTLVEYVKRGRDSGLSLVIATQQPSAVDDRILSQVNITFSHRLSFNSDIVAASNRIPTKLLSKLKFSGIEIGDYGDMLRYLDCGECFLGDHNTSRVVMIKVRPRVSSHGGYSPV